MKKKPSNNTLTQKEIEKLLVLAEDIKTSLSCDLEGFPCRTHRLYAVEKMKRYLKIHNYEVRTKWKR